LRWCGGESHKKSKYLLKPLHVGEDGMNHILVAIDFSEVTDEVISKAVMLNKALNGRLRIVHVEDAAPYSYAPKEDSVPRVGLKKDSAPPAGGKLKEVRARLSKEQLDAEYRLLAGPAADNILAAAREFSADIIVIGAHEHGKFYRLLFGDTTDSLIRKSSCPILVVPHEGRK